MRSLLWSLGALAVVAVLLPGDWWIVAVVGGLPIIVLCWGALRASQESDDKASDTYDAALAILGTDGGGREALADHSGLFRHRPEGYRGEAFAACLVLCSGIWLAAPASLLPNPWGRVGIAVLVLGFGALLARSAWCEMRYSLKLSLDGLATDGCESLRIPYQDIRGIAIWVEHYKTDANVRSALLLHDGKRFDVETDIDDLLGFLRVLKARMTSLALPIHVVEQNPSA